MIWRPNCPRRPRMPFLPILKPPQIALIISGHLWMRPPKPGRVSADYADSRRLRSSEVVFKCHSNTMIGCPFCPRRPRMPFLPILKPPQIALIISGHLRMQSLHSWRCGQKEPTPISLYFLICGNLRNLRMQSLRMQSLRMQSLRIQPPQVQMQSDFSPSADHSPPDRTPPARITRPHGIDHAMSTGTIPCGMSPMP